MSNIKRKKKCPDSRTLLHKIVATCYTHAQRSRVWLAGSQGDALYMQMPTGLCGVHKRMGKYLFLKLIACWNDIRLAKRVHKTQTFWPIQYFGSNTMCENSFNGSLYHFWCDCLKAQNYRRGSYCVCFGRCCFWTQSHHLHAAHPWES